jgi:hypothetical protein
MEIECFFNSVYSPISQADWNPSHFALILSSLHPEILLPDSEFWTRRKSILEREDMFV